MIEEARYLKLKTLKQELEQLEVQYASMFDEINAINGQLSMIRDAIESVEKYQKQKHGFLERFTKRAEYLAYKSNLETLKGCPRREIELKNRLVAAEINAEKVIAESNIVQKIKNQKQVIEQAKFATTLEELGMMPMEVVEKTQALGIPLTWEQGDFQIYTQMHESKNAQEVAVANALDEARHIRHKRLQKCVVGTCMGREKHSERENI